MHTPPEGLTDHPDHSTAPRTTHHRSLYNSSAQRRRTLQPPTDIHVVPLRPRVAAGVRHEPPHEIEAAVRTCHQKGRATILRRTRYNAQKHHRSRHNSNAQRRRKLQRQLTMSRSDRASLPASVTSHRATSRRPVIHAHSSAVQPAWSQHIPTRKPTSRQTHTTTASRIQHTTHSVYQRAASHARVALHVLAHQTTQQRHVSRPARR